MGLGCDDGLRSELDRNVMATGEATRGERHVMDGQQKPPDETDLREMLGHKDMICSRCCVERGMDGEVWCLGCLRTEEANDAHMYHGPLMGHM